MRWSGSIVFGENWQCSWSSGFAGFKFARCLPTFYWFSGVLFKQKTAYALRIRDWSSDVCSSDLSDGKDQFDQVMSAVRSSPELVALGRDGKGEDRFTSRDMIAAEQRLERAAEGLAIDRGHGVADANVTRALASAEGRGLDLSAEQRGALAHITGDKGLASVVGYAGRSEEHTSELQSLMRSSYAG